MMLKHNDVGQVLLGSGHLGSKLSKTRLRFVFKAPAKSVSPRSEHFVLLV